MMIMDLFPPTCRKDVKLFIHNDNRFIPLPLALIYKGGYILFQFTMGNLFIYPPLEEGVFKFSVHDDNRFIHPPLVGIL